MMPHSLNYFLLNEETDCEEGTPLFLVDVNLPTIMAGIYAEDEVQAREAVLDWVYDTFHLHELLADSHTTVTEDTK